jgi:hypothetical protein
LPATSDTDQGTLVVPSVSTEVDWGEVAPMTDPTFT